MTKPDETISFVNDETWRNLWFRQVSSFRQASLNHKPLWLIFQDMSKTYDSVQFDLFTKSLSCICILLPFINILSNLLFNWYNWVITNLGLTNFYSVKNSIDQRETITPLFWRIYYDPLISHIATQFTGYTLQTFWKTNLTLSQTHHLKCSISVLAYMNDTL